MKAYTSLVVGFMFFFASCKEKPTSTSPSSDNSSAVVVNLPNCFTYSITAINCSNNSRYDLKFQADSTIMTLEPMISSSGQAIIILSDSANGLIFADTIKAIKNAPTATVMVIINNKKPRYCALNFINLTADLSISVIGH